MKFFAIFFSYRNSSSLSFQISSVVNSLGIISSRMFKKSMLWSYPISFMIKSIMYNHSSRNGIVFERLWSCSSNVWIIVSIINSGLTNTSSLYSQYIKNANPSWSLWRANEKESESISWNSYSSRFYFS